MTEDQRKRRSPPKRSKSIRNSTTAARSQTSSVSPPLELAVSDAVAHMVKLGYSVLAKNLEEGRAAAKQFRVGEYGIGQVPSDLGHLAVRTLHLARDLSTTTFDLLDTILADPRLSALLQPPATASPEPAKAAPTTPAASSEGGLVPFTCELSGGKARMKAAILTRPKSPAALVTNGLVSPDPASPPITGVTFGPAPTGPGVVAAVTVPADHPAGLYSGIVFDAGSGLPLGALTIQVVS